MYTWFMDAPLEILSSQRPGQNPVQIQQRPFHTRIKINKTQLPAPPFATGIPLPELLIPGKTCALISRILLPVIYWLQSLRLELFCSWSANCSMRKQKWRDQLKRTRNFSSAYCTVQSVKSIHQYFSFFGKELSISRFESSELGPVILFSKGVFTNF